MVHEELEVQDWQLAITVEHTIQVLLALKYEFDWHTVHVVPFEPSLHKVQKVALLQVTQSGIAALHRRQVAYCR